MSPWICLIYLTQPNWNCSSCIRNGALLLLGRIIFAFFRMVSAKNYKKEGTCETLINQWPLIWNVLKYPNDILSKPNICPTVFTGIADPDGLIWNLKSSCKRLLLSMVVSKNIGWWARLYVCNMYGWTYVVVSAQTFIIFAQYITH